MSDTAYQSIHDGKTGDVVVLERDLLRPFQGQKLVMGGVRARIRQLYIDDQPTMPPSEQGIPAAMFGHAVVGNGLDLPTAHSSIKWEVVFDEDGKLTVMLLGQDA